MERRGALEAGHTTPRAFVGWLLVFTPVQTGQREKTL